MQYLFYGSYTVWWGGHTYGPRYMLDVLPLLVPVAAAFVSSLRLTPVKRAIAGAALVWSVIVAATGAFEYPERTLERRPEGCRSQSRASLGLVGHADRAMLGTWARVR